jgi:NAD(P)-dependent dehydrogenase (short-subunit alcohol dehydrogenase family)
MKTVLVSGANRGIGLEICRQLDELGFIVVLGSRDLEKGKEAAKNLSGNVIVKQLDVTDEDSVQMLFESVKTDFGKLDILVNNAGLGAGSQVQANHLLGKTKNLIASNFKGVWQMAKKTAPLLRKAGILKQKEGAMDISLDNAKHIMETNFYGAWRMIQVFVPLLQKSQDARIINISSRMGQLESLTGSYPAYSLSKFSLNALTIMLSNELSKTGIKVNAMCPGWVRTGMGGPDAPLSVHEGADTAVWLATEKEIPSGKFFQNRKVIEW